MKTILVVDDEKELRELLRQGLMRHNYAVFTAGNGAEALEVLKSIRPDLILLDIAMPGMDGYETCEAVRDIPRFETVPVVFLTGKDLDPRGIMARGEALGARGYIPKPSSLQDILEKVKEVIGV